MYRNMADDMLKHGIYVIGFSFPVVPRGHARIRVQLSTAHTDEQVYIYIYYIYIYILFI